MRRSVGIKRFLHGALPGFPYEALRDPNGSSMKIPGFPYEALRRSLRFPYEALPGFLKEALPRVPLWGAP